MTLARRWGEGGERPHRASEKCREVVDDWPALCAQPALAGETGGRSMAACTRTSLAPEEQVFRNAMVPP